MSFFNVDLSLDIHQHDHKSKYRYSAFKKYVCPVLYFFFFLGDLSLQEAGGHVTTLSGLNYSFKVSSCCIIVISIWFLPISAINKHADIIQTEEFHT